MGRLVEGLWIWADKGGFVDVVATEDAGTVVAFELGPAQTVVVARSLDFVVADDDEDATGGNPKIEPPV